jgi:hypothetical protein
MKIQRRENCAGVKVDFEPEECELFMKFALDANTATFKENGRNYFSLSLTLGRGINDLLKEETAVSKLSPGRT